MQTLDAHSEISIPFILIRVSLNIMFLSSLVRTLYANSLAIFILLVPLRTYLVGIYASPTVEFSKLLCILDFPGMFGVRRGFIEMIWLGV